MSGVPYNKPMQPHTLGDICSEDPGHVGKSAAVQSHTSTMCLLMIINGRKGHSIDVEFDDDNDFVATPTKR